LVRKGPPSFKTADEHELSNGEEGDEEEEEEEGNGGGYEKAPEEAPSIDLALPTTNGLFDNFESEQYFTYGGDAALEGKGPSRQGKGVPTTGLNLEVAGDSFPSHRYAVEQDQNEAGLPGQGTAGAAVEAAANRRPTGQDKSLPPTPDLAASLNTAASALTRTEASPFKVEAKPAQQRNLSNASTWSQGTVLGSPASIKHPAVARASPNRINSLTSLSDNSRRGSTATTSSDVNGSTSDTIHNPARRPSSSAHSISEESGYSAPNSSRAWSPAAFDKPNAPITSPLLAPVLGQQQQAQPMVEPSQTHQRRNGQSSNSSSGGMIQGESPSITSPSTPNSTRSTISTPPRPELPTKSRERPSALQPDPATLAKLEKGSLSMQTTPQSAQSVQSVRSRQTLASDDSGDTVTLASKDPATITTKGSINPSIYVPPGALSYTRKGNVVRPSTAKSSQTEPSKESSDPGHTPRGSLDRSKGNSRDFEGSFGTAPPSVKSRFSMASSDLPSAPNSSKPTIEGESLPSDGQIISFNSNDFDTDEDEASVDAVNLLPSSAWAEVEGALGRFKAMSTQSGPSDKGGLLRSVLLPFLALEAETPNVEVSGSGQFQSGKSRRGLFFEWIQQLLLELQSIQTSADRGAILESIACIIESRNFSATMFQSDQDDEKRFYSVFGHILNYAIGELNKKGVYQNTLIFSGRLLGE